MKNPATFSLLISLLGFVWAIVCEFAAFKLSNGDRISPPIAFWLRQAGWIGFGIATLVAVVQSWV